MRLCKLCKLCLFDRSFCHSRSFSGMSLSPSQILRASSHPPPRRGEGSRRSLKSFEGEAPKRGSSSGGANISGSGCRAARSARVVRHCGLKSSTVCVEGRCSRERARVSGCSPDGAAMFVLDSARGCRSSSTSSSLPSSSFVFAPGAFGDTGGGGDWGR